MRFKTRWIRMAVIVALVLAVFSVERSALPYSREVKSWHLTDLPEPKAGDRIAIFAPHEDDELLGVGYYIQRALKVGAHVKVVLMTNGEYPEMAMLVAEKTVDAKPQEFIKYGYQRQEETKAALTKLGMDPKDIIFLGYPDHTLDQLLSASHWLPADALVSPRTKSQSSPYEDSFTKSALHCGSSVLADLKEILRAEKPAIVIAVHPYDIHVDHWGTYAFVKLALNILKAEGEGFASSVGQYNYMIHRFEWPSPRALRPGDNLLPPAGFIGLTNTVWHAFQADSAEIKLKHGALLGYKTQLTRWNPLLSSFVRMNELFGEVPDVLISAGLSPVKADLPLEASGDSVAMLENPGADIRSVGLSADSSLIDVTVKTASKISGSVSFKLELISYDGGSRDLRISTLEYGYGNKQGAYIEGGVRKAYSDQEISCSVSGNAVVIRLPWTAPGKGSFLMLWCSTFVNRKYIDQSLVYCLGIE